MNGAATDGCGAGWLPFHALLVEGGRGYLERFASSIPGRLREVLESILRCRTPALGGQLFQCPQCGQCHYQYHSCNDRHCPRCGQADAEAWLARQRQRLLLPVSYFLVTFTVPEALRPWIRSHLREGLDVLFGASAQALQDLAANPKRLGAQLGMLGVLHTWARTLIFHPHIHFLVPGGGLSPEGRSWIATKDNYLFAVKALGAHFRTLFQERLLEEQPELFPQIPAKVWKQRWVVHCQPAGSGENVLRYLSRYLFKTATANRTVSLLANGKVRWPYRDSKTGAPAFIDLEPHSLINRFLQHVLPRGYCRVRLFGWLHPAAKLRANRVRALLKQSPLLSQQERRAWQPPLSEEEPAVDEPSPPASTAPLCPRCQKPMNWIARWKPGEPVPQPPRCRSP
jgi:putative transposase/transposase-like zinc-binding protein